MEGNVMVKDSERQQFMALYNRVFEPDGITPKNCTRYACIDLIQFCDIIVPHKIPAEELPHHKVGEEHEERKKELANLSYYGNLGSGFMNVQRIHALYLELKEEAI